MNDAIEKCRRAESFQPVGTTLGSGKPASASDDTKSGLYAYVLTPFDRNGDVDTYVLTDYVEAILESGVDGVTCVASTTEGPYLTEAERRLVAEAVSKTVAQRAKINVGIGAVSTRQVIEFAKHAQDVGATSLMLDMQQYFPISFDTAVRHFETVAETVNVPIRLYNITAPTRFDFTPDRLASMDAIDAITSVKEASGDVDRIRKIRALCGDRFGLFCGFHFQTLDAFRLGARGWEAAMHPLFAKLCVELYRALVDDPWSEQSCSQYQRLEPMFQFLLMNGVPQSVKAMSQWTDLKLGAPRAPLAELPTHSQRRLKEIMTELDLI